MLIEKSKNGWELCTITNDKLSCDNFNLSSDDIDRIKEILQPEFGSSMKKEHIMIGYDNWSGVFIMQMPGVQTNSSDDVIKKIYDFLSRDDLRR